MSENPIIFRLDLIIGLLVCNLVLMLILFLPLELLLLGGILPAFLVPFALLGILRLR